MWTRSFLLSILVAAGPVSGSQADEEGCQRLQAALGSLLRGSEEERLAVAESAEDAFDDLDDDACSRSVMKAVDWLVEREEDAFLVFRLLPGWATVDDRVAPLLLALERDEPDVRLAAVRALWNNDTDIASDDVPRLLQAFRREKDPRVRLLFIEVLGEVGLPETGAELAALARADNDDEAAAALRSGGDLVEPGVVLGAWRRRDPRVKEAALGWMTEHLDTPGVFERVLEVAVSGSQAAPLRARAAEALFELEDARAPEAWLSFVLDSAVPLDSRVPLVSRPTQDIPWRRALEEIVRRATAAEDPLRTAALRALGPPSNTISCFLTGDGTAQAGTIRPRQGDASVPCLSRPDPTGAVRGTPLAEGLEVAYDLTWSEGGRRWLGVQFFEEDRERLCWIEEERFAPSDQNR